jgi:ABC-type multidrug transport system fused ATPase/permease subunit
MRTLLRLGPFLRPYRLQVALALSVTLVLTVLLLLVPAIIRQVIDVGLMQSDGTFLLAAWLCWPLVASLLVYAQRYLSE